MSVACLMQSAYIMIEIGKDLNFDYFIFKIYPRLIFTVNFVSIPVCKSVGDPNQYCIYMLL